MPTADGQQSGNGSLAVKEIKESFLSEAVARDADPHIPPRSIRPCCFRLLLFHHRVLCTFCTRRYRAKIGVSSTRLEPPVPPLVGFRLLAMDASSSPLLSGFVTWSDICDVSQSSPQPATRVSCIKQRRIEMKTYPCCQTSLLVTNHCMRR